jgi:nucleoside-diphosphate-sugar epimerase
MGTLKILQYAREIGVERFVYTSSSCVYGNINEPISESTHNYSLDTPYAVTKLLGEQYVNFFHKHHNMPTVILRLFNSHGPGEYPGKYRNVIPNFMYRVLKEFPIVITGTGEETRDFTYVGDIVQALLLALTEPHAVGEVFNVGTGVETSIRSLVESIAQVCGKQATIEYKARRAWDSVNRRRADISHIRSLLNYKPNVNIHTGLALTYQWFMDNKIANFDPI